MPHPPLRAPAAEQDAQAPALALTSSSREYAMSDTFSTRRPRLSGALTVLLTAAAVAAVLVLSHGVPEAWWPQTGNAFPRSAQPAPGPEGAAAPGAKPTATAASTPAHEDDPCDLIVGPAHDYCAKGKSGAPSGFNPSAALLLAPAVIGIVVVRFLTRRKA
ncbi:hypothetical protein [Streptomyces cavernicola]|uniref:Uncharacterized protein n=1 Tax=Streptomyces cavernicola TaxID=3043613 RepID=A0ABT6SJH1_9ACTN|nr:hypothetical protein [Streptomyces sp. B-S-A6]MDI3408342.1 hypothetical protein [Streptomyces sp. B-S-A6]